MRPLRAALPTLAAFAGSTLVAVWAHAIGAPTDQYGIFNKGDTTIVDQYTRLTWDRAVSAGQPQVQDTFASARASCANIGMRLPTYKELLTLVDEDPHAEYDPNTASTSDRYIDPNAFPGTPAGLFWSLTADPPNNAVKVVNFGTGATGFLPVNANAYWRCVK